MRLYEVKSTERLKSAPVELTAADEALELSDGIAGPHFESLALLHQADSLVPGHDTQKAIKLLERAQEAFAKEAGARKLSELENISLSRIHRKMALFYYRDHDYQSALRQISVAIEENPAMPADWRDRALLYKLLGKPELARSDITKAQVLEGADRSLMEQAFPPSEISGTAVHNNRTRKSVDGALSF